MQWMATRGAELTPYPGSRGLSPAREHGIVHTAMQSRTDVEPRPPASLERSAVRRWERRPRLPGRVQDRLPRYDGLGLAVAALFVCLSLTPSLLPRGPAFQGWLSGVVAAAGYGLGVLVHRVCSRLARRVGLLRPERDADLLQRLRRAGWTLLAFGAPAAIGTFVVAARGWQREAHRLVRQDAPGPGSPVLILALMASAFVVLVGSFRLAARATRALDRQLSRWLPVIVAGIASIVLVAVAIGTVFDQVVLRIALAGLDRVAAATNDTTPDGVDRPADPARSGSSASLVNWDDLGYEGRVFVSGGPSAAQLSRFSGWPAKTPIRAYVGLLSADDARERAALAVAELERTGAFDRKVLCVVTTTGTGWVDNRSATALEYLYNGDTAIVATQYSYLPSPVSFVFDDDAVELEGATLLEAVQRRWRDLPAGHRPKMLVYGESLGSNGGPAAFGDLNAMRRGTDGALFVGPPSSNSFWESLVNHRAPGSPERLPVYGKGADVRFAASPQTLDRALPAGWTRPRVLFLQHANDPVVWWTPDLLFRRPDWLTEARGPGVSPSMSWYPIVTFWQVTADLAVANHVPRGNGHRYGSLLADGWAAVAAPPGWTPADTIRLRTVIP
jgi:uncharacterized membrane protein